MGVASYLENILERLERDLNALDQRTAVSHDGRRKVTRGVVDVSDPIIVDKSNAIRKAARELIAQARPLVDILKAPDVPLALQIQILQKTRQALETEIGSLRKEVKGLTGQLVQTQRQLKFWKDQNDRLSRLGGPHRKARDLTNSSTRTPRKRGAG